MLELEGQIKIEEMCFYLFLEDGKDSAAGIELGRSFTRWEQLMKKSVKVILCLFVYQL